MITTTLNDIRKHSPCKNGWTKLLKHLGKTEADDAPLPLLTVLDSNGLDDALWCLRALPPEHSGWIRTLACDLAQTAMQYTDDPRPQACIDVARRYAAGEATDTELAAAQAAAAWAELTEIVRRAAS